MRYMGTKSRLIPHISPVLARHDGGVVDVFGGIGAVARSLRGRKVLVNDSMHFLGPIVAAEVCRRRMDTEVKLPEILSAARARLADSEGEYAERILHEEACTGSSELLREYMARDLTVDPDSTYELVSQYFGGTYFSLRQALVLDALRFAIDEIHEADDSEVVDGIVLRQTASSRDLAISAWLRCASVVINSPGHTAQFLKPTERGFPRVLRQWRRDAFAIFSDIVKSLTVRESDTLFGTASTAADIQLLESDLAMEGIATAYLDPPYTKDHYSRMYHVLETMYLYDYPRVTGVGRVRENRFRSAFSVATEAPRALTDCLDAIASRGLNLVLSYPSNGLLQRAGSRTVADLVEERFVLVKVIAIDHVHSTFGASKGAAASAVVEQLFVGRPR
jgi:adenine-specific DNA-methyltransferase